MPLANVPSSSATHTRTQNTRVKPSRFYSFGRGELQELKDIPLAQRPEKTAERSRTLALANQGQTAAHPAPRRRILPGGHAFRHERHGLQELEVLVAQGLSQVGRGGRKTEHQGLAMSLFFCLTVSCSQTLPNHSQEMAGPAIAQWIS